MIDKLLSQMSKSDLEQVIQTAQRQLNPSVGKLPEIPPALKDPATPPAIRAQILEAYTGRLNDYPHASWSAEQRALVREQCAAVVRGM